MFRYGGPIKEGIMSGIKEPRRGYNQGDMVAPLIGVNTPKAANAFQNVKNQYTHSAHGDKINYDPYIKNQYPNFVTYQGDTMITEKDLDINQDGFISSIEKAKFQYKDQERKDKIMSKKWEKFKAQPNTTDKFLESRGLKFVNPDYIDPSTKTSQTSSTGTVTTGGKSPFEYTVDEVIEKKGKIDDTPPVEKNKKERVNTILESLGYDRAQKNALYDAMIKAGQRVSRGGLGAENLVSDVIAETSQSYDKPEKLREAANLMDVQQQLKLEQIKESKDTRSPLQKNAEYLLEAGVVENSKDAVLAAQGKATEANDIFFEARQKLNSSQALDQTALTLGSRDKFGKGIVFKNKVPKKYKGEPIKKFLDSGAFRGDGLYTADGKIMLIQDGKIKSELIVKGSIEEGLFSFGEDD